MKVLKHRGRTRKTAVLSLTLGLLLLLTATALGSYPTPQIAAYNDGLQLYQTGQVDKALQAFDQSLANYQQQASEQSWLSRQFRPSRSTELAALAYAKKGNLYAGQQKLDLAIAAYKESLRLNPGDSNSHLDAQARDVKYNLELVLKSKAALSSQPTISSGQKQQPHSADSPATGTQP